MRRLCRFSTPIAGRPHLSRRFHSVVNGPQVLVDQTATFEDLGIHDPILSAVFSAFPNVKYPTRFQEEFIPAILSGRDVLLKDHTGTGKTFGMLMALMDKPRARKPEPGKPGATGLPTVSSLVIVPHRDLAYQLLHWIECVTAHLFRDSSAALPFFARVLVRGGSALPLTSELSRLRSTAPHILIGTPQALLDAHQEDSQALSLEWLTTVAVDEIDYMIEAPPDHGGKSTREKALKKFDMHPSPARQLLDIIYADRLKWKRRFSEDSQLRDSKRSSAPNRLPQLIVSSATVRNHLRHFLFSERGWFMTGGDRVVRVDGSSLDDRNLTTRRTVNDDAQPTLGRQPNIVHSAVVVSADGNIVNVDGAVDATGTNSDTVTDEAPHGVQETVIDVDDVLSSTPNEETLAPAPVSSADLGRAEVFALTPSPFNPAVLEAIATSFALDVPHTALLVLPATAPVQRAVHELREVGINALALNLLSGDKGRAHLLNGRMQRNDEEPTLLVSTLASTRGIDMPELSHVFLLGVPEGRRADNYLHVSGRVGRFGRRGTVITFLEEPQEGKDEPTRMGRIFKDLGITPLKYRHVK